MKLFSLLSILTFESVLSQVEEDPPSDSGAVAVEESSAVQATVHSCDDGGVVRMRV